MENETNNNNNNIKKIKSNEDQLLDYINEEIELNKNNNENINNIRNPKILLSYLNNVTKFNQYININNLNQKDLLKAFSKAKYLIIESEETIFKQNDKPEFFYLIINGKVDILYTKYKSTKNNNKNNKKKINPINRRLHLSRQITLTSKIINKLSNFDFFGEYAFIYQIKRTNTAIAKTDPTYLIAFDEKTFNEYFLRHIINGETEKKFFIYKYIKPFKNLTTILFNSYYRNIKRIFLSSGNKIITNKKDGNSIFLIYKGECAIKKDNKIIVILDKGDIFGLECLFGDNYEFNIVSNNMQTIIFEFEINDYLDYFLDDLRDYFQEYYSNQKKIIEEIYLNQCKYKEKLKKEYKYLSKITQNDIEKNRIKNGFIYNEEKLIKNTNLEVNNKKYFNDLKNVTKISFPNINNSNTNSSLNKNKNNFRYLLLNNNENSNNNSNFYFNNSNLSTTRNFNSLNEYNKINISTKNSFSNNKINNTYNINFNNNFNTIYSNNINHLNLNNEKKINDEEEFLNTQTTIRKRMISRKKFLKEIMDKYHAKKKVLTLAQLIDKSIDNWKSANEYTNNFNFKTKNFNVPLYTIKTFNNKKFIKDLNNNNNNKKENNKNENKENNNNSNDNKNNSFDIIIDNFKTK